ncbi:MAG: HK97 gp10 family phage protein [Hyphomicrobiales bacterium]
MSELRIEVDPGRVQQALRRAPRLLERELARELGRVGLDIANDWKDAAPKATSVYANSINVRQPDAGTVEIFAGVDYARLVEEPTGPQPMPPVEHIEEWITTGAGITPNDPADDPRDLAWRIARSIARGGTRAQPAAGPALEKNRANASRRVNAAIDRALEAA